MKEFNMLKQNILFKNMSDEEIACTLHAFHEKHYHKGQVLFHQGDLIEQILIILKGDLEISNFDFTGNKKLVAILKENEIFAESVALSSNVISHFNLLALSDLNVLTISKNSFLALENTTLLKNMIQILANKNTFLTYKMECINKRTIQERVYEVLSYYYHEQKHKCITLPYNKTQLAEYLCVNRSSLTREIQIMEQQGLFVNHLNTYELTDEFFKEV